MQTEFGLEQSKAALMLCMRKSDIEAVRAHYWTSARLAARRVAVLSANIPKERADDPLTKFSAFERDRINASIKALIDDLQKIQRGMCGA